VPTPDAVIQAKKRLGLGIEQVTPMLAKKYGLATEAGLLVTDVQRGSVAANAGIEPGDVVMALGRYRVSTLDDLSALIQRLPATGRVGIRVARQDTELTGYLTFGTDDGQ
jgi:serine protease Do